MLVVRLGACQFEAICQSAGLAMSPMELCSAVLDYLKPFGAHLADRLEGKLRGHFGDYLQYMVFCIGEAF